MSDIGSKPAIGYRPPEAGPDLRPRIKYGPEQKEVAAGRPAERPIHCSVGALTTLRQDTMRKGEQSMKIFPKTILIAVVMLAILPSCTPAQEAHPKKKIFRDFESWPTTAPGDVKLKNFSPFRAVYDRTYSQGSGPNAGDPRHDRVIISAEDAGWDGTAAAAITIIDSGIVEHKDTNARVLTMFVGLDNLQTLFEIGPIPGKAKDYYIGRITPDSIYMSMVTTDTQKLEPKKMKTDKPGFGPNAWVMASMNLRQGMKINLAPTYSPRGNSLTSATYGHIVSRGSFTAGSGMKYQSWVLETSRNLSTPRVSHIHLIDRPPYYLGTETVDLATGERKPFVWLRSVDMLKR